MSLSQRTREFVRGAGGKAFLAMQRDDLSYEPERDLGDTASITFSVTEELFQADDSDGIVAQRVVSEAVSVERTGSIVVQDIQPETLALLLGGASSTIAQAAGTVAGESLDGARELIADRIYQLGMASTATPVGARRISDLVVRLADGINEVQTVTIDATGGTFTLAFGAQTTAALDYNAAASAVQSALEALSTIGAGNVTVTKSGDVFTVTFVGALSAQDVAALVSDAGSLTGGGGTAVVATTVPGDAHTTFVLGTDYEADLARGRIRVVPGGDLAGESAVVVDYDRPSKSIENITSGSIVSRRARLRFVADNAPGKNRDFLFPLIAIRPEGDFALKDKSALQTVPFAFEALVPPGGTVAVYINDVPAA